MLQIWNDHKNSLFDLGEKLKGDFKKAGSVVGSGAKFTAKSVMAVTLLAYLGTGLHYVVTEADSDAEYSLKGYVEATEALGAKIEKINPVLDSRTGTLNIHCHIDKKDMEYTIPGMFVNASVSLEEREFNGLPMDAIIKEGNEYYAFIVNGNYFEKKLLDNPRLHSDFVTFDGLRSDKMVVSGAYYVE